MMWENNIKTKCKYRCDSVKKFARGNEFLYEAEFFAVTGGSAENDEFFKYTPYGSLKIGLYKENTFQPGKEYYIDIFEINW